MQGGTLAWARGKPRASGDDPILDAKIEKQGE